MNRQAFGRLIGYAGVSTEEQGNEAQLMELKAAGCHEIHHEHGSGASRARPVLARLLAEIKGGDVLVVVRLDRLARSVSHLLARSTGGSGRALPLAARPDRHLHSTGHVFASKRDVVECDDFACSASAQQSANTPIPNWQPLRQQSRKIACRRGGG